MKNNKLKQKTKQKSKPKLEPKSKQSSKQEQNQNSKKESKKVLKSLLLLLIVEILVILIIVSITIFCIQKYFFFVPNSNEELYNDLINDDNYDEIIIDNDGKKLTGWLKYNSNRDEVSPLVIFFVGNCQNSSWTIKTFSDKHIFDYFSNYNILIIDYPEYGKSEGKISEKSFFQTAEKTYDYALTLDCVDKNNIVVFGYSIGTGAATYLASQRDVNGLILVAPYDEALSLYNANLNIFYGPLKNFTTVKLESYKYATNVTAKTLIFTSYDDEIISYKFSENLSKYFNNLDEIIVLDNKVNHNSYFYQEDVLNRINTFLNDRK